MNITDLDSYTWSDIPSLIWQGVATTLAHTLDTWYGQVGTIMAVIMLVCAFISDASFPNVDDEILTEEDRNSAA